MARFFVGVVRKGAGEGLSVELAEINGWPTVVTRRSGAPASIVSIETDGVRIFAVHVVSNPDKLLRV